MEMPNSTNIILGFDPGGKTDGGNFGWCICSEDDCGFLTGPPTTGLAKDAKDAIRKVKKALMSSGCNPSVLAAGIDAPLFWSTKGDRQIDEAIRNALRNTKFPKKSLGGTPVTVNSLRGSVLVQGMLLGHYLREEWTDLEITESHPRALKHLLKHTGQIPIYDMAQPLICNLATKTEHERDATWCAVAAWAMVHQSPPWKNLHNHADQIEFIDMYTPRGDSSEAKRLKRDLKQEGCPVQPFDTPVSYWMPVPQVSIR
jgi:hypothetical protein